MKRTQIWCDYHECGRLIQDKHSDQGSDHPNTIDNIDKSWEIWSPEDKETPVFCSPDCLTAYAMGRWG